MKSWISFLLPEDEYKEKKLLYFIAEGAVILLLALFFIFISSYFNLFHIDFEFAIFAVGSLFSIYVFFRYILSGMEYTEVVTKNSYKKELKMILKKTFSFVALFMLLYFVLIVGIPSNPTEWIEIFVLPLLAGFFWFLFTYISLRKSYKKNRKLL